MLKVLNISRLYPIIAASAGILFITFLVKLAGYGEKILLAYYFGTGYETDVYQTIFTLITTAFVFCRELVEPGFLQLFLRDNNLGIFNLLFRVILIGSTGVAIMGILFPVATIHLIAPGFSGPKIQLAVQFISISFAGIIFYCLSALTNAALNGMRYFTYPATGDLLLKLCIPISILFAGHHPAPVCLAYGILAGCICRLAVHLIKVGKYLHFRKLNIAHRDYSLLWQLSWPLIAGMLFSQLTTLIDNWWASGLPDGTLSALSYARKVIELPVILLPYTFSIVLFPYLTRLNVENRQSDAQQSLRQSCHIIIAIFLPLAIFFFFHSDEIICLIYKRGAFSESSLILTTIPFRIYSCSIVFLALETILVIYFYAKGNTFTPIITGIGCAILHILLTYFLMNSCGYLAIAYSFVISKTVKNIILLSIVKPRFNMIFLRNTAISVIICMIAGGIIHELTTSLFLTVLTGAIFYIITLFRTKTFSILH